MPDRSIEHRTKVPEIRKGDTVVVLAGKDAGKRGKVERGDPPGSLAVPASARATAARRSRAASWWWSTGLNIARKHTKPRQRSQGGPGSMPTVDPGGILDRAMPIPVSRVMVVCGHCDRPTRVGHRTLDNGTRVRTCHHCGEPLEVKA